MEEKKGILLEAGKSQILQAEFDSPAAGQTTGSAARGTLYQSVQLEDSSIKMLQFVELV